MPFRLIWNITIQQFRKHIFRKCILPISFFLIIRILVLFWYYVIHLPFSSLAVVVPKFWYHIKVPEQLQAKKMLEEMKKDSTMYLAKRKFCDESIENEDADHDTPEGMLEVLLIL